ncbi:MAG: MAPEG family protein [Silanimonas sp.]
MTASPWVWPMLAMVGVVLGVWVRLYATRIPEMKRRHIHPQKVASNRAMVDTMEDQRAADNFRNLFELPVLLFAACLAALVTGVDSPLALGLAWGFVASRALHSIIHCTYNTVMHRFQAYAFGGFLLFGLWGVLGAVWAGWL